MDSERREFLKSAAVLGGGAIVLGTHSVAWAKEEKEVPPAEDLMREHGALNRILLIYEDIGMRLEQKKDFDPEKLKKSAGLIQKFIENYHEKNEEEFLFPRFLKAGKMTDLVSVLQTQHEAGRALTSAILSLANSKWLKSDSDRAKLKTSLHAFVRMYRPHEAREDTVLFPEFKKIVSEKEYHEIGEKFEDREKNLFGQDGFETIVRQIEGIEKDFGLYDLNQFSPRL